ncbi:MAG TPA: hypothetical protein VNF68_06555 [Candidatus Baltobacteraceae bacterium]|nr:hypothetical protein [Candidatus Baltobacteraceae bacterium]
MFILIGLALLMVVLYVWIGPARRAREGNEGPIVWRGGRRMLSEDAARRMVERKDD